MGFELVLFLVIGGAAVVFAIGMLLSENAVHSALFLIGNFACVALLFLMLDAPFIAMVQIAVYAGAIMVLFLFVIMLLGAEKTTDTTRRFRWLTGAATTLAISLLVAVGLPLVATGFDLPEYEGNDPQVRFVHGALAPTVLVEISNADLNTTYTTGDFSFSDVTAYVPFAAGDYDVRVLSVDGDVVAETPLQLRAGDMLTVIAYGDVLATTAEETEATDTDVVDETGLQFAVISNSLQAPANDRARMMVFNGYSQDPLALVDLGPNRTLDIALRGEEPGLFDRVIADDLNFGELTEAFTYPEGTYEWAFVNTVGLNQANPEENIVLRLREFEVLEAAEQPVILVAEPPITGEPGDVSFIPAPRVLDRDNDEITLRTAAAFGSPAAVGQILFTDYLLPVNLVGFLLLVALVGVIVLSRPEGENRERRSTRRRKVSRPLVSVIAQQTGTDVLTETPRLDQPSGDQS